MQREISVAAVIAGLWLRGNEYSVELLTPKGLQHMAKGWWRVRKQNDYIVGPRDLGSDTWYLNPGRLRGWDHIPVVVEIEVRDLKQVRGRKGWAANTVRRKRKVQDPSSVP